MRLSIVAVGVSLLSGSPAWAQTCTGCAAPSFAQAPRFYALPSLGQISGSAVAVADMNGDDVPDQAFTVDDGVAVLLADGSGGFRPATQFPGPPFGGSIAVADFDRDGHADLITTSSSGCYFWRGDGNGALAAPVQQIAGLTGPVAAADLDGDGKPDAVVGMIAGSVVLTGDGAGGFSQSLAVGFEEVVALAVADLNQDGRPDLVTLGPQGLFVRLHAGSGFGAPTVVPVGVSARDVRAADVDGDGRVDLVVLEYGAGGNSPGAVSVLRGNGQGSFGAPAGQAVDAEAKYLAVGDLDLDGRADAVVVSTSAVGLLLGQPNGTLLPQPTMAMHGLGMPIVAELDQDGLPDVAILMAGPGVVVYRGAGAGGLENPPLLALDSHPRGMASGYLNPDPFPDLAVSLETNVVQILLGQPDGLVLGGVLAVGALPGSLALADYNNDGRLDIAVLVDAPDRVRVYLRLPGGTFGLASSFAAGPNPGGMASGDLNGDGKPDLVVGNAQDGEALYTFVGNGDGTFGPPLTVPAQSPSSPLLADFNGDGHLDVIAFFSSMPVYLQEDGPPAGIAGPEGYVMAQLFLGNGDGTLQPFIAVPTPAHELIDSAAAGDVDGDGDPDLFVSSVSGTHYLANDGGGGFGPPSFVRTLMTSLVVADVNGDGRLDLLGRGPGLDVLLGDGQGGFELGAEYAHNGASQTVALDLDGDSRPEFAYADFSNKGVRLLRNTNCRTRRFRIATDVPPCNTPGQPFAVQPVLHAIDDGGNRVQCETGEVRAALVPGQNPPGAVVLGNTTVTFTAGAAAFTDLAVDLPGSCRLQYESPAGSPLVLGRPFGQGLSVTIQGPDVVEAGTSASFDASPGFEWYDWSLDGAPVSTAQSVTLGFPTNGSYAVGVSARKGGCAATAQHGVVAGPLASIVGSAVTEGDVGSTPLSFTVSLSAASALPVTLSYASADLTALAGSDYTPASGVLSFAPGETARTLAVSVLGDAADEPDEVFAVKLTGGTNAVAGASDLGRILDDDGTANVGLPRELVHGAERRESLAAAGSVEVGQWHLMRQQPRHSYEVVVDEAAGGVSPLTLERLAAGGSVLQTATAIPGGSASLRFQNDTDADVVGERFRVRSGGCTTTCGPEAGYRIRAYDSTGAIPRFNNAGTQITVLVLQSSSDQPISGHAYFRDESGVLLLAHAFGLGPHASLALNTATLPGLAGTRGSVEVASDAPFGALSGKSSALEVAAGFTFDTPMSPRPR